MKREAHKTFAQVGFSRIQSSGGQRFYGSDIPVTNYITLEIKTSEKESTLTSEHYFAKDSIIRVNLTNNQFAEMITSMNRGDGVPCTIESIQGEHFEKYEFDENRKEYTQREFKDKMIRFSKTIAENQSELKRMISKGRLNKTEIETINSRMAKLTQDLESNIPYFASCFQETMDKVVIEAKTELENVITTKVQQLGLHELQRSGNLMLNSLNSDDNDI